MQLQETSKMSCLLIGELSGWGPGMSYSLWQIKYLQQCKKGFFFLKDGLDRCIDQDHPQEKECKKVKWLSEEDLKVAEKRKEAKDKWEKERYTHLNAEFQRKARRDKKAFLCDQYKETEENNQMGQVRDLFKEIRDIKVIFIQRWAQ